MSASGGHLCAPPAPGHPCKGDSGEEPGAAPPGPSSAVMWKVNLILKGRNRQPLWQPRKTSSSSAALVSAIKLAFRSHLWQGDARQKNMPILCVCLSQLVLNLTRKWGESDGCPEGPAMPGRGRLTVSICTHNTGVFPPKLQGHPLQVAPGSGFFNQLSNLQDKKTDQIKPWTWLDMARTSGQAREAMCNRGQVPAFLPGPPQLWCCSLTALASPCIYPRIRLRHLWNPWPEPLSQGCAGASGRAGGLPMVTQLASGGAATHGACRPRQHLVQLVW